MRSRILWLRLFLTTLLVSLLVVFAQAMTVVIPTDDELIIGSRVIVQADVLSTESSFDDTHTQVFTYTTLRVNEVLKGAVATRRIVIKELGGDVGGKGVMIFGAPEFTPGEKVVLFLDTWPDGSLRTHQMFLGKFSIVEDAITGEPTVTRLTPKSNVEIKGRSRGAVTDKTPLDFYLRMIRKKIKANREPSGQFESKYYSGAPILDHPQGHEPQASSATADPQFHLFRVPGRMFEPDLGQPVSYLVNPDQAPSPAILADVTAAMNAWSQAPGCSLRVVNGGPTDMCVGVVNMIVFDNCDGRFAPVAGGGVLALGGFGYDNDFTVQVNGVTFTKIRFGFISVNPFGVDYAGIHCSVQEILTHEMGHSLGLHHSWQPGFSDTPTHAESEATMFFSAHFDGRCASLKQDDINGITFIYPAIINITPAPSLPGATAGSPYSQALGASGGKPPYSWSLVAGGGQLPPGLSLSSTGVISGLPPAVGSYSFTVQVTDSASFIAQKLLTLQIAAPPLSISTLTVPFAIRGSAYSQQLIANGGTPPYTWSLLSGSLPAGLTLDSRAGLISGTPDVAGSFSVAVAVKDLLNVQATRPLQLLVVDSSQVPRIDSAKYKQSSGKLVVRGQNFDAAAKLLIDGQQALIKTNDGAIMVVKQLNLAPGAHELRIVNPNEIGSVVFVVSVN